MDADHLAALTATRRTLHGIAEHIFAGYQYRAVGRIALAVRGGGFGTAWLPAGGDPAGLELADGVLLRHPGGLRVQPVGSLGAIAERLGVPFGLPGSAPYPAASGCTADDVAVLDVAALDLLVTAWVHGDAALRRLARDRPTAGEQPEAEVQPVLWPEHLDVAITMDEVNYGISAGDAYLPEPYAYVGPWVQRAGEFWNAPFGAARPVRLLPEPDAVLGFFRQGRRAASA